MASVTVTRPDLFPAGTSVSAYVDQGRGLPASGPPPGTAVGPFTVASDGSLTLSGLADKTSYVLYASSPDRYLHLNTSVSPSVPLSAIAAIPGSGNRKAISTFQSGHGFAKTGGNGTVTDDATVALPGMAQSLKLAMAGDQVALTADKTFTAIDLSAQSLIGLVRIDDRAHIKELSLQVTADNFVNFSKCTIVPQTPYAAGDNHAWTPEGDWYWFSLSRGDFGSGSGTTNWAAINKIRLRANDNGTACNAWFALLGFRPDPAAASVIIEFDDNDPSVMTAAQIMAAAGFRGVTNTIVERVGTPTSLTLAQLQALRDLYRWDVCPHAYFDAATHTPGYDAISAAAAEFDMRLARQWHIDNGFSPDFLALPHGTWTSSLRPLFAKYFRTVRTVYGTDGATARAVAETWPPADPLRLRCWQIQSTDTPAAILTNIDKAITNKESISLLFHQLVSSVTDASIQYLTTDFQTLITGLAGKSIAVRTRTDWVAQAVA